MFPPFRLGDGMGIAVAIVPHATHRWRAVPRRDTRMAGSGLLPALAWKVSDHEALDLSVRFLEGNEASNAVLGQKTIAPIILQLQDQNPLMSKNISGLPLHKNELFGVHVYRIPPLCR